ncbi:MAG: AsnC family transcriptional regulator [Thaumarchaeota archaeon]|nr:AsnC family transcriptional regulator [Nitrososphaerota archaeon]MBI3641009.1 AsnC family transcriptional regulator [Nitrososphaerota archaeon]
MSDEGWSNLDEVDQKIIAILNKNARTPSKEIATELNKLGVDVSDRTIRKRIERLEKNGIIKGYTAVLSGVSSSDEFDVLFLKFKVTRSIESITESVKTFVKTFPNYLFVATIDGEWNMIIVMKVENVQKNPTSKIIEKFSEQILDYRTSEIQIKDINLLNMSLLLLT